MKIISTIIQNNKLSLLNNNPDTNKKIVAD